MDIKTAGFKKKAGYFFLTFVITIGVVFLLKNIFPFVPETANNCGSAYRMEGYKSYFSFLFKKEMKFPAESVPDKCFYEFYEGVYEASAVSPKRYADLENICAYISKAMPVKSWNQCFFKFGIALTYTKRTQIRNPDKLQKFVDSKIKFCEGIKNNSIDCIVGVYTGIDISFINDDGDSVFPIKNNDPFWLCKVGMGLSYKLNCYRNTVSYIYKFTNGDMNKAVEILNNNLPDAFERFEIKLTYFSSLAYMSSYKYPDIHKLCLSFADKETRYSCIEGYATGLDEVLTNGQEGPGVIEYCLNSPFSFDEKGECLRRGFFELPTTTDLDVKKAACESSVPAIFKTYCDVAKDIPIPK